VTGDDAPVSERSGFELPLLLLGGFRSLIDELHVRLARQGHEHARPIHGFALQALGQEGVTISELGRRLGVSKQAAAKTAANLEQLGYASRVRHPNDGRAWVLAPTASGIEMLTLSAAVFEQLHQLWVDELGQERVRALEDDLETILKRRGSQRLADTPGWLN
jgi:DNA-binding MarR family transcriptional regulator